jgi:GTP-binding protein EngB required for normal cell division
MFQFINSVLGQQLAQVSDGSSSCTRTVETFNWEREDGLSVTMVDGPGFDHSTKDAVDRLSDTQILQMMADFLKAQ